MIIEPDELRKVCHNMLTHKPLETNVFMEACCLVSCIESTLQCYEYHYKEDDAEKVKEYENKLPERIARLTLLIHNN